MRKILIIIIGLSLILPIGALAAWKTGMAADCVEYCNEINDGNPVIEFPDDKICVCDPLAGKEFEDIVADLINFIFSIAVVLFPLMIVIAAILFVTAAGSTERTGQAKKIIIWSSIGFAIMLLAKGLLGVIQTILGVK